MPFEAALDAARNVISSGIFSNSTKLKNYEFGRQYAQNEIFNEQANRWNKEIASWQNDLALSNWALENSYNSPREQMNRYLEAGLNPNLVYGAGASSGNAGNIGTPTLGGSTNASDLSGAVSKREATEISRNQMRINAASTALGMLSGATNLFEKLMTIKSSIDAKNSGNVVSTLGNQFKQDYWNALSGSADKSAQASLSNWIREDAENQLKAGIARYQTDSQPPFDWNNAWLGTVRLRKPNYMILLDNALSKSQNDLTMQGLQIGLNEVMKTVAENPIFGSAAQARMKMNLWKQQLINSGIDELIKNQIKTSYEWQNKLHERTYNWMPWKNIGDIISGFWPRIGIGFGKSSNPQSGRGVRSTPGWFNEDYPYNF